MGKKSKVPGGSSCIVRTQVAGSRPRVQLFPMGEDLARIWEPRMQWNCSRDGRQLMALGVLEGRPQHRTGEGGHIRGLTPRAAWQQS